MRSVLWVAALLALVASAAAGHSAAADPSPPFPCTYTAPDGSQFDFSGLTSSSPTGVIVHGSQSDVYAINVCGVAAVDGPGGVCATGNSTVCLQYTWAPNWNVLAAYAATPASDPPTWSLLNPASASLGVSLTFANGVYGAAPVSTVMQFFCTEDVEPVYEVDHTSRYDWVVSISSSLACPLSAPYPCAWTAPDGTQFNFSALATDDPKGVIIAQASGDTYALSLCGVAAADGPQGVCNTSSASLCFEPAGSSDWFALADYARTPSASPPSYSLLNASNSTDGVALTFRNGKYDGSTSVLTVIELLCAPDGSKTVYSVDGPSASDSWTVTILSPLACGSPPPVPCGWTSPEGAVFDFTPLRTPNGTWVEGENSDLYAVNVCGLALGDGERGLCARANASVCLQYSWSPNWFAIAEFAATPASDPPAYSLVDPGSPSAGVALVYHNGAYGPHPVTTSMHFLCGSEAEPAYTATSPAQYEWIITVTSSHCCPKGDW